MADRTADERSPLIDRDNEAAQPEDDTATTAPSPEKRRTWWQIGWYTTLWLLAGLVAVVFVKGFIDADDVEVCLQPERYSSAKTRAMHMGTRYYNALVGGDAHYPSYGDMAYYLNLTMY